MRAPHRLLPILFAVSLSALLLAGNASAAEGPNWRFNLDEAERQAMETHRLVLIHFWAPWCGPCRALEGNVFGQPGVGAALERRFVPVKINEDDHAYSATSRLYGIQSIPTDVVITPSGRLIAKIPCPQEPRLYVAQLMRAADSAAAPPPVYAMAGPPAYTPAPTVPATPPAAANYPPEPAAPRPDTTGSSMYSNSNMVGYSNASSALPGPADTAPPAYAPSAYSPAPAIPPAASAPQTTVPAAPASPAYASSTPTVPPDPAPVAQVTAQQPVSSLASQPMTPPALPARPPLGLDGYCPVTLIERHHETPNDPRCWVQGNPRWGVVHRGTVYLFVGPEEQKRFLANPDRYSPALSGNDPVVAFDQGRLVQGTREFGTFFGDRIYLFSSRENLAKFAQSPAVAHRYAEEVRQAEATSGASLH